MSEKPTSGIAVDGYCKGNPGPGGYRGVDIETGEILFEWHSAKENPPQECTNNIAEFIGIVHGLGYAKTASRKYGKDYHTIYSDSEIALAWVKAKACGTKFNTGNHKDVSYRIWKCEMFLVEQKRIPEFKKWDTKNWGEIPADFGNKKNK